MRILITGASGNVGRGIIPKLQTAGHALVLSDLNQLPAVPPFAGLPFVPCDVQAGFGLEHAAAGCDLILHLPAWHGIHSRSKTEMDYWRLNVDGTFWMFQAAASAGIKRVVFLSSQSWHHHYHKYGFTKRIGEELCEYHRINHGVHYVAVRPADFTPWGDNYVNGYGARLLRGGVDRQDVLDCIAQAVAYLGRQNAAPEQGVIVDAVRPNAFTSEQIADWEADPLAACERLVPGSRALVEKYHIDVRPRPVLTEAGPGAAVIGYQPTRHFGTFLAELARLDAQGGEAAVRTMLCPY